MPQAKVLAELEELAARDELPELDDAAAMYGSGDAVTGLPCIVIAIAIFVTRP